MTQVKEVLKKICLLGDAAVGKTSLIRRYVLDMFDDRYITTIGTKVTKKVVETENPHVRITLLIWDILGQKEYQSLHPVYYQGAEGALIVSDGTRNETIKNLYTWANNFISVVGRVPLIFLVNKSDIIDTEQFDTRLVHDVTSYYGSPFYFTSAKTGANVENAFMSLSTILAQKVI